MPDLRLGGKGKKKEVLASDATPASFFLRSDPGGKDEEGEVTQ